jgi:hypothetical protein
MLLPASSAGQTQQDAKNRSPVQRRHVRRQRHRDYQRQQSSVPPKAQADIVVA